MENPDKIAAVYWWWSDHYDSRTYVKLCSVMRIYTPSNLERFPPTEESRRFYRSLCLKANCTHEPMPAFV